MDLEIVMSIRLANRSSDAIGYHSFGKIQVPLHSKTRLYMICKTSLVSAVVAQPGRALDLFRGEAEDRAVVSSNLTDGTSHLFYSIFLIIMEMLSIILPDAARWFLASNMAVSSCSDKCLEIFISLLAASKKCSPLSSAENATLCMSR
jgi:hypothetical protein